MTRLAALTLALVLVVGGVATLPSAAGNGAASAAPESGPSGGPGATAAPADSGAVAVPSASTAGSSADNVTGPPTLTPNSSARMVIESPTRSGNGTAEGRVSVALSTAYERIRTDHRSRALTTEFAAMASDDDRASLLGSALLQVERRVADLRQRQRAAIRGYANGTVSRATLLREMARIHQEARATERHTAVIQQLTEDIDIVYLLPRIQRATAVLASMQGPVRERIARALDGEASLPTVHVEADEDSLLLAFVEGDRYVRESVFLENIQETGDRELESTREVLSRTWQFYPWVDRNRESNIELNTWGPAYRVRVSHRHGELTTYLDTRSAQVFREVHRLDASKLPREQAREVTENGIRVVLNRTYRGGPMRVELYDADTGAPLQGSVSLGNRSLGQVDATGTRWIVEPRDEYRLTVTVDGTTVTVVQAAS